MKIIRFESENVKRLVAVYIDTEGSPCIVIGGKNDAGKSSILDSIQMALAGESSIPPLPIRKGQERAQVKIELDDLIVTRVFTARGTRLEVTNKQGASFKSPQAILDRLVGKLSFDPLAFAIMKREEQLSTLKKLVGVDFSMLDAARKKDYDERSLVNRDIKAIQVKINDIPSLPAPAEEVSVSDLTRELEEGLEHNAEIDRKKEKLRTGKDTLQEAVKDCEHLNVGVERLIEALKDAKIKRDAALSKTAMMEENLKIFKTVVEGLQATDLVPIRARIADAEKINTIVRNNKERSKLEFELKKLEGKALLFSDKIDSIDRKKVDLISSAKFPVRGLGLTEDYVMFDGIPFVQCGKGVQIKVSVAMGLAMNPELKVILIRDGALLDKDNLSMVAKMMEEAGGQVWIEKVTGNPDECKVFIEDGTVKGATLSQLPFQKTGKAVDEF